MPIQTNCAQAISIFHTPLPGILKDVEKLRRAFAAEKLRKGKLDFVDAKNPLVHGRIYKGNRIIIQIADPLPIEVIGPKFWEELGRVIAKTKEPWWDFGQIVEDWKPKKSRPEAHALSAWRVTRKDEFRCLFLEDL